MDITGDAKYTIVPNENCWEKNKRDVTEVIYIVDSKIHKT
jgi:hypothetical protein